MRKINLCVRIVITSCQIYAMQHLALVLYTNLHIIIKNFAHVSLTALLENISALLDN